MNRAEMIIEAMKADAMAAAWAGKAKRVREELTRMAVKEFENDGVAPSWRTDTATVPLSMTSDDCKVVNNAEWMAWVHANHPDQLEEIVQVRPAWQKTFFSKLNGLDGTAYDDDGQIIPGLLHVPGGQPKAISIRPKPGVREALMQHAEALVATDATQKGTEQ